MTLIVMYLSSVLYSLLINSGKKQEATDFMNLIEFILYSCLSVSVGLY